MHCHQTAEPTVGKSYSTLLNLETHFDRAQRRCREALKRRHNIHSRPRLGSAGGARVVVPYAHFAVSPFSGGIPFQQIELVRALGVYDLLLISDGTFVSRGNSERRGIFGTEVVVSSVGSSDRLSVFFGE